MSFISLSIYRNIFYVLLIFGILLFELWFCANNYLYCNCFVYKIKIILIAVKAINLLIIVNKVCILTTILSFNHRITIVSPIRHFRSNIDLLFHILVYDWPKTISAEFFAKHMFYSLIITILIAKNEMPPKWALALSQGLWRSHSISTPQCPHIALFITFCATFLCDHLVNQMSIRVGDNIVWHICHWHMCHWEPMIHIKCQTQGFDSFANFAAN